MSDQTRMQETAAGVLTPDAPKPKKPRAKKTRAPRTVSKRPFIIEKLVHGTLSNSDAVSFWSPVVSSANVSGLEDTASCIRWIQNNGEPDAKYRVIQECAVKTVRQKQMNVLE